MSEDLEPHSKEWYDRLAGLQAGYHYPWRSSLGAGNGEDAYTSLVMEHLSPDLNVVDCGCGHGVDALAIADRVRSVVGYDRVRAYIELAEEARIEKGVSNVRFVVADSAGDANAGHPRIPVADQSIDLFVSRRGPRNWIADVRRAGRSGAVLIQLNPMAGNLPVWNEELPSVLRLRPDTRTGQAEGLLRGVLQRLEEVEVELYGYWTFDVPEWLNSPPDLYEMLIWGRDPSKVPPYLEARPVLEQVFSRHGTGEGFAVQHRRFLWKAVL